MGVRQEGDSHQPASSRGGDPGAIHFDLQQQKRARPARDGSIRSADAQ